jgi:hypothetical protein
MPRSILTEKLSRRGYHLSREYGVDPLEIVTVAEVMTPVPEHEHTKAPTTDELQQSIAYSDETCRSVAEQMATTGVLSLMVVDRESGEYCGTVGATELLTGRKRAVLRESERRIAFLPKSPEPIERSPF